MPDLSLADRLKSADTATLQEILREAEVHLSAQLSAAVAADQRAYTFAGTVTAASVLLVSAAYVLMTGDVSNKILGWSSVGVAVSLFAASWMAVISARSVDFEFAGNQPGNWADDIDGGKPFNQALAEQCAHYDLMIISNRRTMEGNSRLFNRAVNAALTAVGVGGLVLVAWIGTSTG